MNQQTKHLLAGLLVFSACTPEPETAPQEAPQYTQPAPDYASSSKRSIPPAVGFTDVTAAAGILFEHETGAFGQSWMPETMGAGVGFFDIDADGDDDALFVNGTWFAGHEGSGHEGSGDIPTAALYANRGDGTFDDVTAGSGVDVSIYGMGISAADYNADGHTDLFLTTLGPNLLLRGEGEMRFSDATQAADVAGVKWTDDQGRSLDEWSTATLWADVDNDGWPDLFVTNYVHWSPENDLYASFDGKQKSYATPQQYPGSTPRLYHNLGDGTFAEVTEWAGLLLPDAKSMGVASADFDEDGWVDLVVTNDTQPNYLLRNQADGTFVESGTAAGIGYDESGRARAGMGVDIGRLSADGRQVIGIGNFSREAMSLYTQAAAGKALFIDGAGRSRLVQPTLRPLTFGLKFFDYDLDGRLDLMLANGHIEPGINAVQKEISYAQPPQLFWNDGHGGLADASAQAGPFFSESLVARGLAVGDLEGDGDVDVLLSTNGGAARVLRNDVMGSQERAALVLNLQGQHPALEALGATVQVQSGEARQSLMVRTGSSYLSQHSPALVFGLGAAPRADKVTVRWSDGNVQELGPLAAGHYDVSVKGAVQAAR